MRRGEEVEYSEETARLVLAVVGPLRDDLQNAVMRHMPVYRASGRLLIGWVPRIDADGRPVVEGGEMRVRRRRFRIPKGHPWRGVRPNPIRHR